MKAEIEINGFEICIEEIDGKVSIKVEKNEDVVEEIVLDPSEYEEAEAESLPDGGEEAAEEEKEEVEAEEEVEESIMTFEKFLDKK